MTVWEAYCNTKLRNIFKNEYLQAQGMKPSQRSDLMTRFKVYIDRFNGIPDVMELRRKQTVGEVLALLDHIFTEKWQNHIHRDYRAMPGLFRQYGHFLLAEQHRQTVPFLPVADEGLDVATPDLTDFERPYIDGTGKLTIIARPALIAALKTHAGGALFDVMQCIATAQVFYRPELFTAMSALDWQRLVQALLAVDKKKQVSRTGVRHAKLRLQLDGTDRVLPPLEALLIVAARVGWQKAEAMRVSVKGMPLVVRRVPIGKDRFYARVDDAGLWVNSAGSAGEKARIIRMMGLLARITLHVEEVMGNS